MWKCTSLPALKERNKQLSGGLTLSQLQFSTPTGNARRTLKASSGPLASLPALPAVHSGYDVGHSSTSSGSSQKNQRIYRGNSRLTSQGSFKFASGGPSASQKSVKLPSLVPQEDKEKWRPSPIDVLSSSQNLAMSGPLETLSSPYAPRTNSSCRTISPVGSLGEENSPRQIDSKGSVGTAAERSSATERSRNSGLGSGQLPGDRRVQSQEDSPRDQNVWLHRVLPFVHRLMASHSPKWVEWVNSLPLNEPLPASIPVDTALLNAETLIDRRISELPLSASDDTARSVADAALEEGRAILKARWDAAERRLSQQHATRLHQWHLKAERHRAQAVTVDAASPVTCLSGAASLKPPGWKPSSKEAAISVVPASSVVTLQGAASLQPSGLEESVEIAAHDADVASSPLHVALLEAQQKLKLAEAQLEDAQKACASAEALLKQRDETLADAQRSQAEGWHLARTLSMCSEQADAEKSKSLQVIDALEHCDVEQLSSVLDEVQNSEVQMVPELVEAVEQKLGQLQPEREAAAKELTAAMHGKWMPGDHVVVKSAKGALVRVAEDRKSKVVTTLATGTYLELLEVQGRRARIAVDNVEGWLGEGKWGMIDHVEGWVSTENAAGGVILGPATKTERIIDPETLDKAIVAAKRCGVDDKHIADAEAQLKSVRDLHDAIEHGLTEALRDAVNSPNHAAVADSIGLALAEARKYGLQGLQRFSGLVAQAERELIQLEHISSQVSTKPQDKSQKSDENTVGNVDVNSNKAAQGQDAVFPEGIAPEAPNLEEEHAVPDGKSEAEREAILARVRCAVKAEDVVVLEAAIKEAQSAGISKKDLAEPLKSLQELSDLQVFLLAAKSGDTREVSRMLKSGIDPNLHGKRFGDSALQYAAAAGHKSIVKALVRAGADVNAQNVVGATALMHAASHGRADVVSFLLQNGASTGLQNAMDKSALDLAGSHEDVIGLLLSHAAENGEKKLDKLDAEQDLLS